MVNNATPVVPQALDVTAAGDTVPLTQQSPARSYCLYMEDCRESICTEEKEQ